MISHTRMYQVFCLFLAAIVGLLLFTTSKQPIHVHVTMEEITEELCDGEEEGSNNKENTVVGETKEY